MKLLFSIRAYYHQYVADCMEVCEIPVSFKIWFETAYYHEHRDDVIREVFGDSLNGPLP